MTEHSYPTARAQEIAVKAKELALSEGVDWKSLEQEQRREYKVRVQESEAGRQSY